MPGQTGVSDAGFEGQGESQMLSGDGLQLCRNWGSVTPSDELWMSEFVRTSQLLLLIWLVNFSKSLLLIGLSAGLIYILLLVANVGLFAKLAII